MLQEYCEDKLIHYCLNIDQTCIFLVQSCWCLTASKNFNNHSIEWDAKEEHELSQWMHREPG